MLRRILCGFRILIAVGICTAVTPALSEVKFDIKGVYGDRYGCKMAKGKFEHDSGQYISSKGYQGYEWQCKIAWAHKEAGENMGAYHGSTVWSVITLCAAEGEAYSRLLSIQQFDKTVTISDGANDPVVLNRCK